MWTCGYNILIDLQINENKKNTLVLKGQSQAKIIKKIGDFILAS